MNDDPQQIHNIAPNQGAQGMFHGPVTFDQRTMVSAWAQVIPTDPVTIAAARDLLAQLPTDTIPDLATLPPGSRALARVSTFVGRQSDLRQIAAALKGGQTTAINQAASGHGLGGVGKTTVASEFVHRYGRYFAGGVFWLSFAIPASIAAEIAQCGGAGGLQIRPDFHDLPLTGCSARGWPATQHAVKHLGANVPAPVPWMYPARSGTTRQRDQYAVR